LGPKKKRKGVSREKNCPGPEPISEKEGSQQELPPWGKKEEKRRDFQRIAVEKWHVKGHTAFIPRQQERERGGGKKRRFELPRARRTVEGGKEKRGKEKTLRIPVRIIRTEDLWGKIVRASFAQRERKSITAPKTKKEKKKKGNKHPPMSPKVLTIPRHARIEGKRKKRN